MCLGSSQGEQVAANPCDGFPYVHLLELVMDFNEVSSTHLRGLQCEFCILDPDPAGGANRARVNVFAARALPFEGSGQ